MSPQEQRDANLRNGRPRSTLPLESSKHGFRVAAPLSMTLNVPTNRDLILAVVAVCGRGCCPLLRPKSTSAKSASITLPNEPNFDLTPV